MTDRRTFLAGVAGAGVVGGGAWVATNGLPGATPTTTVETVDARGSTAGEQAVPVPGEVTLVDLFATWCAPCEAQMNSLVSIHEAFGDRVRFVSVTNERFGNGFTRDDLREWWVGHEGNWTLGADPESRLQEALGAGGIPYLVVADADGRITWRHGGLASEASIRRALEGALDG
ncbi:TlpA family protein disulfide reductase [Halobium salinum]|uniref:TlpA family protein disulfide reductase n=1 Tax=Halobium salinum TaxID=1364940 RepID=A0ABD5P8B3_9EURY|nr:TlpA disulfide reductase family protein [Halobium salinum]